MSLFGAMVAVGFALRQPLFLMLSGLFLLIGLIPFEYIVVDSTIETLPVETIATVNGTETTYEVNQIYTPTTNFNATSSGTVTVMNQATGSTANTIRSGGSTVVTQKIASSSAALHQVYFNQVTLSLSKTGSPTGLATIGTFDGAGGNVIDTCNTLDVSTLTGSQADVVITCSTALALQGGSTPDRIGIKYTGGDVSNLVNVYATASTDIYDSTNSYRSTFTNTGTWSDATNADVRMTLKYVTNKLNVRDGSQTSYWINNVSSESPLCLDSDLGQIALLNGFRYTGLTADQIVNVVKLYTSSNASVWDFRESINLTDETSRQTHLTSADYSTRYVRLCVDEYGTGTTLFKVNELDYVFADAVISGGETTTIYTYEEFYASEPVAIDVSMKVLSVVFAVSIGLFGWWLKDN